MKRSGKFYRKNEQEVMEMFGLKPTKNSGSGWIEKEDGQNDNVICQLKSTDKQSLKINLKDLQTLEYNALVSKKLPIFMIQYLQNGSIYVIIKPEILNDISTYISTGSYEPNDLFLISDLENIEDTCSTKNNKTVKSSEDARVNFKKEIEKKFAKRKKSAL